MKLGKRRRSYSRGSKLRRRLAVLIAVALVVGVAGVLAHRHSSINGSKSKSTGDHLISSTNSVAQGGGAVDQNGQATTNTAPSQWITSSSGNITLKQPVANQTFKSGGTLAGSAKIDQVQYRIIDNKVGKIAEGPINVVNGNFSAILKFTTNSTSGRIDVFSYNSSGAEINEVTASINF